MLEESTFSAHHAKLWHLYVDPWQQHEREGITVTGFLQPCLCGKFMWPTSAANSRGIFDRQKQKPREICPKEWHLWVSETSGWLQQVLEKCLLSLSSITCCGHILWGAAHKYHGGPEALASLFFARKSSLDWSRRLRTDRPEELDETWFLPHRSSRALLSSPHGVVIKLKLLKRTSCSLNWFAYTPLTLPFLSGPFYKVLEVFPCGWTRCSEPSDCTYLAFLSLW